jgi:hypothetical protein
VIQDEEIQHIRDIATKEVQNILGSTIGNRRVAIVNPDNTS